jgi:hypothetical protein
MDDNIGSILGIIDEEEADDLVMLDGPPVANENDIAKEDGVTKKKAGTSKAWKYFTKVGIINGGEKCRCNKCGVVYSCGDGTTHLNRHTDKCVGTKWV